jgi:hypothetical protein
VLMLQTRADLQRLVDEGIEESVTPRAPLKDSSGCH